MFHNGKFKFGVLPIRLARSLQHCFTERNEARGKLFLNDKCAVSSAKTERIAQYGVYLRVYTMGCQP